MAKRIEVISVGGTKFKNYVTLAVLFNKKIAIVTDRDEHNQTEIKSLYERPGINHIQAFTPDSDLDYSIEPTFVHANSDMLEQLIAIVHKGASKPTTEQELISFMESNKTEWAYRLLESGDSTFTVPQYIENAINWIVNNDDGE